MNQAELNARIPGLLRHMLTLIPDADIEAFKKQAHPMLVGAWVCLELGAERDGDAAAEAMRFCMHYMTSYADSRRQEEFLFREFLPMLNEEEAEQIFACTMAAALEEEEPKKERQATEPPDITVAYEPTPDSPPGYFRIVARHGEKVVFDETMDPIETGKTIDRILAGDPEIIGDVPRIQLSEPDPTLLH